MNQKFPIFRAIFIQFQGSDLVGLHGGDPSYALGGGAAVLGSQFESLKTAVNNQDVLNRINALLDDTLDINNLGLGQGKAALYKDLGAGLESSLPYSE